MGLITDNLTTEKPKVWFKIIPVILWESLLDTVWKIEGQCGHKVKITGEKKWPSQYTRCRFIKNHDKQHSSWQDGLFF